MHAPLPPLVITGVGAPVSFGMGDALTLPGLPGAEPLLP